MRSALLLLSALSYSGLANETLTADYLHGPWCLTAMGFGGAPEPEGRNWVFEPDGRFMHQNSVTASGVKHAGNWRIEGEQLAIEPVYLGGAQEVIIEGPDQFEFHWQATLYLTRGPCH